MSPGAGRETAAAPLWRAVLSQAIDYAGLFPPAQLDMAAAVANYRRYRSSDDAWALGRLVAPVSRLEELAAELRPGDRGWRIAAVASPDDPPGDAARIAAWNRRQAGAATVDVIEAPTPTPAAVAARVAAAAGLGCYCEIAPGADHFAELAAAVAAAGARAKIRTGGVQAAAIPAPAAVARFVLTCARLGLAFKATAGLHHALRGEYALTYEPGAAAATMHGFLNLLAATLLAASEAASGPAAVEAALAWTAQPAPRLDGDFLVWHDRRWSRDQIAAARRRFIGFGSCSFEEPLQCLTCL